MQLMHPTPSYEGGPATAPPSMCGDLFGWLFGIVAVPTPAYETAEAPKPGAVGATARDEAGATDPTCQPSIIAPTGPVTIVLGGTEYRTE